VEPFLELVVAVFNQGAATIPSTTGTKLQYQIIDLVSKKCSLIPPSPAFFQKPEPEFLNF
jgi:hypothetical protein